MAKGPEMIEDERQRRRQRVAAVEAAAAAVYNTVVVDDNLRDYSPFPPSFPPSLTRPAGDSVSSAVVAVACNCCSYLHSWPH